MHQRRHTMVLPTWKPLLPIAIFVLFVLFEEWVSFPSCSIVPSSLGAPDRYDAGSAHKSQDLKVMMVADLLLLGPETGFFNSYFRDYYMSKFFKKSFYTLKPDMLLVLGDFSAKGSKLSKTKWVSVLHQFHRMLGPFLELPLHVVLGDRDVGQCNELDVKSVHWLARNFPGLDSAGCGAFEISNVSFVSLNSVALLCGINTLRFSVERVIETERTDLRMDVERALESIDDFGELKDGFGKFEDMSENFQWRGGELSSGSGPVLLLHLPLHHFTNNTCQEIISKKAPKNLFEHGSEAKDKREFTDTGPYELSHTIPPNATEYIFQALKPRIVFSAHTHKFCDRTHSDGTREVTVPTMTWKVRDDPGFVVATFRGDRNSSSISYCSLARESHVLIAYSSLLALLLTLWIVVNTNLKCLRQ
ncbi:hypothetical protein K2173_026789 [Erythroxylum novogranatense]|uniref:Calcineurin-like phosphoesterase domain-containing protein n=1 Tax=Erythroxylum novogranatense TaxID=1862640 RepID=A0AAV8TX73_9ROSI|nr:hypothetical protein K2173_026789 [Erythroxylum novogranatense]